MFRTPPLTQEATGKTNDRFASTMTLARWRLRQTGGLLFMASLGFVAAMVIACIVPLFTTVAAASSLQAILQSNTARSTLTLGVNTQGLSSKVAEAIQQQVTPQIQQRLVPYQEGSSYLTIQESSFLVIAPAALQHSARFNIYASSLKDLQPDLHLISGRWPISNPDTLEIMLTPRSAQDLGLKLGDRATLQGNFTRFDQTGGVLDPETAFTIQVVGLFEVPSPGPASLHTQDFQPDNTGSTATYTMLTNSSDFLHTLDTIAARLHTGAIFSFLMFQLSWDYRLHTQTVRPDQVSDLTNRLFTAQTIAGNFQNNQQHLDASQVDFPYIAEVSLYSPEPGSLELLDLLQQYTNRITLVSIPITILAVQIIALLLFFVSLLIGMLLDRQMTANAMLSSRGASNEQIFWSLFLQGVALCLLGIILGPLVGALIVFTLISGILPEGSAHTAQGILAQPLQIFISMAPTAGGTLLAALLTISLIVRHTSGLNMLTLRRETARTTRQPFWQRYYLDMLAAAIALSGYGISLYLASIAHEVDTTTQALILAPLTLIAPLFLLLGCLLLFLRIFPWFLRVAGRTASRGGGATTMLALVQMSRSPRQIVRMTLLLSLTVAFAIFAQVFSASQTQRINDISAFEAGADFSGDLTNTVLIQKLTVNQILAQYQRLPGVLAASADFTAEGETIGSSGKSVTIQFRAIEPQSYKQTIIWNLLDAHQSLSGLLSLLPHPQTATLPNGTTSTVVPAIIDQAMANQLRLPIGGVFSTTLSGLTEATLNYKVAAIVAHIPTVNSSTAVSSSDSPGGMLVNYDIFSQVYDQVHRQHQLDLNPEAPPPTADGPSVPINHIWLRTTDAPQELDALRIALNSSKLAVNNLYDRRQIASELQDDPLNLNILIILGIGGLTAFLLALIGNLVSSWMSVYNRRSSFVVLRALGATSRQVAGVLLWEQGIIYIGAILLGIAFGAVLANIAVPVLVFTGLPEHGPMSNLSINDLYLLQHALPPQIITPFSLDLIFGALILICIVALGIMIRAALHPSISNELRLSED